MRLRLRIGFKQQFVQPAAGRLFLRGEGEVPSGDPARALAGRHLAASIGFDLRGRPAVVMTS